MENPKEEPKEQTTCNVCKNPIPPNEPCYQLRFGAIEEDRITFLVDEDVGYYHQLCMVDFS